MVSKSNIKKCIENERNRREYEDTERYGDSMGSRMLQQGSWGSRMLQLDRKGGLMFWGGNRGRRMLQQGSKGSR